jgi:hypothetical protein
MRADKEMLPGASAHLRFAVNGMQTTVSARLRLGAKASYSGSAFGAAGGASSWAQNRFHGIGHVLRRGSF